MKKLFSKKGFSLVEIMVAVGLMGGLSMVTMHIAQEANKTKTDLTIDADILELQSNITTVLNDRASCIKSLDGLTVSSGSSVQVSEIYREVKTSMNDQVIAKIGEKYNNNSIEITDMQLEEFSSSVAGYSHALVVTIDRLKGLKGANSAKKSEFKITIPLVLIKKGTEIAACYADVESEKEEAAAIFCAASGGEWDSSATTPCDLFATVVKAAATATPPGAFQFINQLELKAVPTVTVAAAAFQYELVATYQNYGFSVVACDPNQYVTGFNDDGSLICEAYCPDRSYFFSGIDANNKAICRRMDPLVVPIPGAVLGIVTGFQAVPAAGTPISFTRHNIDCTSTQYYRGKTSAIDNGCVTAPDSVCPDEQYANAIGINPAATPVATCEPIQDVAVDPSCATGEYATGFDANGHLTCATAKWFNFSASATQYLVGIATSARDTSSVVRSLAAGTTLNLSADGGLLNIDAAGQFTITEYCVCNNTASYCTGYSYPDSCNDTDVCAGTKTCAAGETCNTINGSCEGLLCADAVGDSCSSAADCGTNGICKETAGSTTYPTASDLGENVGGCDNNAAVGEACGSDELGICKHECIYPVPSSCPGQFHTWVNTSSICINDYTGFHYLCDDNITVVEPLSPGTHSRYLCKSNAFAFPTVSPSTFACVCDTITGTPTSTMCTPGDKENDYTCSCLGSTAYEKETWEWTCSASGGSWLKGNYVSCTGKIGLSSCTGGGGQKGYDCVISGAGTSVMCSAI